MDRQEQLEQLKKEKPLTWWIYTKEYDLFLRIVRPVMLLVALAIFFYLVKEIETAKLLLNDPCEICMNKTGATCFLPYQLGG